MEGFFALFLIIYIVCHIPAIVFLILGLVLRKSKPDTSKGFLIAVGVYFLVGGGICGAIMTL